MNQQLSVDVVIPVLNEEKVLRASVQTLRKFLSEADFPYNWRILIADSGSTDNTLAIAKELSEQHKDVAYTHLDIKGRGRALRKAWTESTADIVSYMDVDLSSSLESFPPMIEALHNGYDVGTGTRHKKQSKVTRSLKREILSRGYNFVLKLILSTSFPDAQCGFKAATRNVVQHVVPQIKDNEWFFDTELLVLSQELGYKIKEVPVTWIEDKDSRVKITKTVTDYLRSVFRLKLGLIEQRKIRGEIPYMGKRLVSLWWRIRKKK